MEKKVIIDFKDVEIGFTVSGKYRAIVKDLNIQLYEGETLGLVGESGSGKTTIGRAVMRINPLTKGEILFNGERISDISPLVYKSVKAEAAKSGKKLSRKISRDTVKLVHQNIQMIFQDPAASLNERATVDYIIAEGIDNYHLYKDDAERTEKLLAAINNVGLLPEHLSRYPHEFSGGQRQRIGIARALIMEPKVIVADEPISALDVSIRAQVINLLKKIQKERGLSYLFIAHDLSVVRFISDRIAVIHNGLIVELCESDELFKNPLHPYTKSLLQAIPQPDPRSEREKEISVYDASQHDYSKSKPSFHEIIPGHFIYANDVELAEYKKQIKK